MIELLMKRIFILIIIISSTNCLANNNIGVKDCFAVSGDSSSIVCRSIPQCNENVMRLYHLYTRIVFDLENKYSIRSDQFYNCSFSWANKIELEFKNIKLIKKYAFESIKLDRNVRLTLKFDGSGLNLDKKNDISKLTIVKDAFRNMKLDVKSQLFVEIYKYGYVEIQDTLINTIQQDENTELHLNIHDCDQLIVTSKSTSDYEEDYLDDDGADEHENHGNIFKTNQTFTFEMTHLDSLKMDSNVMEKFKLNPYSGASFIIRYVHNCYLGDMLFRYLMLGPSSQFNFLVESVTSLGMGINIFDGLYQDQNSVFYLQIDQIGLTSSNPKKSKRSTSNDYDADDYYDYEYQESTSQPQFGSSFSNWLCLPEGLFKNVRQYESSLAQIQFSQIDMSISVSSKSFSEIQLNENSKFQISFQDINGHILFDRNAINRINVGAGLFEIWTENHKQQDLIRGNQVQIIPKSNGSNQQQPLDTLRTMKIVKNSYLKLMELAINQIYLTSRSFFRFGFVNSNSIFLINPKSLNGFVIDSFKKNLSDENYRPKIEFEINDSENVKFNFLYKDIKQPNINKQSINNIDYDYDDEDITNRLPKLIEIDGYQPEMSLIRQDGTIEAKTIKKKSTELTLIKEFCQFHTLRPYMASIQRSQSGIKSILTKNLVYFTESIKYSAELDTKNKKLTCTSCLFIYLYRTIQRRVDFYYVKDYLPQCFINLHFKNSLHFPSVISQTERHQLISNIEQSFKYYWKILNCKSVTDLDNILDYDEDVNPIDEVISDYDKINKHCKDKIKFHDEMKLIRDMDSNNWHENSLKICSKNVFDSKQNYTRIKTGLRADVQSNKKKIIIKGNNDNETKSNNAPMAILMIVMMGTSFLIIYVYLKYKRPKRPCIRLNFNRNMKSFQRLNNQASISRSPAQHLQQQQQIMNNNREDDIEPDLNGYEYDDEFEMNNNDNEEHVEFHQVETTPVKSSKNNKINKSIEKIKQFKNNLFNKNVGLYSNFKNPATKYSHYGYNSTDSTLVQTKVKNEFELSPDNQNDNNSQDDRKKSSKSKSIVTYEKGNQNNLVTKIDNSDILDEYDEDEIDLDKLVLNPNHILNKDSMRMATNPMGVLDFELDMDLEMEDIVNNGDEENDQNIDTVNTNKNTNIPKNESNA